jgi:fructose-1-phosphate kinase PfkB-like protein
MSENNQATLNKHTCETKIKEERKAGKTGNHYALRKDFTNDEEFYKYVLALYEEGFENVIIPQEADKNLFTKLKGCQTII